MSKKIIIKNSDALKVQNFCEEMGIPYEIEDDHINQVICLPDDLGGRMPFLGKPIVYENPMGIHIDHNINDFGSYIDRNPKDFAHSIGHEIFLSGDIHAEFPHKILLGAECFEDTTPELENFILSVDGMQELLAEMTQDEEQEIFHTLAKKKEDILSDDSFYHKIGNQKKSANKRDKFSKK